MPALVTAGRPSPHSAAGSRLRCGPRQPHATHQPSAAAALSLLTLMQSINACSCSRDLKLPPHCCSSAVYACSGWRRAARAAGDRVYGRRQAGGARCRPPPAAHRPCSAARSLDPTWISEGAARLITGCLSASLSFSTASTSSLERRPTFSSTLRVKERARAKGRSTGGGGGSSGGVDSSRWGTRQLRAAPRGCWPSPAAPPGALAGGREGAGAAGEHARALTSSYASCGCLALVTGLQGRYRRGWEGCRGPGSPLSRAVAPLADAGELLADQASARGGRGGHQSGRRKNRAPGAPSGPSLMGDDGRRRTAGDANAGRRDPPSHSKPPSACMQPGAL